MVSSSRETYVRSMKAVREAREAQREEGRRRRRRAGRGDGGGGRHDDDDGGGDQPRAASPPVGARVLGMHLEGPFFAPARNGAHDLRNIVSPSYGMASVADVYGLSTTTETSSSDDDEGGGGESGRRGGGAEAMIPNLDGVDVVTLAPELPGSHDVIRSLAGGSSSGRRSNATADDDDDDGGDDSSSDPTDGPRRRTSSRSRRRRRPVVVSLGHTNATYDDGVAALSCGATLITHLYNAMESFHHRNPGLAGLLSSPCVLGRSGLVRPYWSIIVDGVHVHDSAVRMAYRAHPGGCVLVTDAMSAMGLDGGGDDVDRRGGGGGGGSAASATTLGSVRAVISPGGDRAVVDDGIGSTLAGSVSPMDGCVRRFMSYVDCPAGDALLCATRNPAMVLGRHVDAGGRGRRRRRPRAGDGRRRQRRRRRR